VSLIEHANTSRYFADPSSAFLSDGISPLAIQYGKAAGINDSSWSLHPGHFHKTKPEPLSVCGWQEILQEYRGLTFFMRDLFAGKKDTESPPQSP